MACRCVEGSASEEWIPCPHSWTGFLDNDRPVFVLNPDDHDHGHDDDLYLIGAVLCILMPRFILTFSFSRWESAKM